MRRIFDDYAYGDGPRSGCWWDETCDLPETGIFKGEKTVDVAIVGAGFTGLSAALALAQRGLSVAVLEAEMPGWGASGRNGGFCCLGGGIASDAELDARCGREARLAFRRAERDAVSLVEGFIDTRRLDVDRHSYGETLLAHRVRDVADLYAQRDRIIENHGVEPLFIDKSDLPAQGMQGGPFFGAMTIPLGFGLNPRKYLASLITAAQDAGAVVHRQSPVRALSRAAGKNRLTLDRGLVLADHVIVATNGYASETLPPWLAGRYMPAQSTVIVTRPLTGGELQAQGWTTAQMCYDTRRLLHYFRLMPDGRFLFGMRGALMTGPRAEAGARARTRADFERMFPAWAQVETPWSWSGFVSLARNKVPFVGQIPGSSGIWSAMCYHGNGVAMGSYAGNMVAQLLLGQDPSTFPSVMQRSLARFPLGRARRVLMAPLYAGLKLRDRF